MNKIIIDGKEYELSDELSEKIKAEVALQEKAEAERLAEQGPFARVKGKPYFLINGVGKVSTTTESESCTDDELYSIANYCRDKELMKQRALRETLNRLLWRYSEMHGGDATWDSSQAHFYIYWEIDLKLCTCMTYRYKDQGTVYFRDVAIAQAAIEEVVKPFMAAHPEFVW